MTTDDPKQPRMTGATLTESALVAAMAHALNFHTEAALQSIDERLSHIEQMLEQIPRDRGAQVQIRQDDT